MPVQINLHYRDEELHISDQFALVANVVAGSAMDRAGSWTPRCRFVIVWVVAVE